MPGKKPPKPRAARGKPSRPDAELAAARAALKAEAAKRRDIEKRLTEAREQQAATAEILRVLSSSPTDTQPVFETIVRHAVRLCDALFCAAYRFDGALIYPAPPTT